MIYFKCVEKFIIFSLVGNPFPALNGTPVANIELKWVDKT